MTTTFRKFVLMLALGLVAGTACAAPTPHDNNRNGNGHDRHHSSNWEHRDDHRYREQAHREREWQRQQREESRRRAEYQRHASWRYPSRYSQHYDDYSRVRWERGHRYYGRHYVVRDYNHYHLRRPPYGHHWVRDDGKYLLVAIATGLILDIASR